MEPLKNADENPAMPQKNAPAVVTVSVEDPQRRHSHAYGEPTVVLHESIPHENAEEHHHHTHTGTSQHGHGHHLLQVEDLSVGVTM